MGSGVFAQLIQMGDPVNLPQLPSPFERGEWGARIPGGTRVEVFDIETAPKPLNLSATLGKSYSATTGYPMRQAQIDYSFNNFHPTHIVRARASYGGVIAWAFLVAPSPAAPATPSALISYLGGTWFPKDGGWYEAETSILAEAEKIARSRGYTTIKVRASLGGGAPRILREFRDHGYTRESDTDGLFMLTKDLPVAKPTPKDSDPAHVPPSNFTPTEGDPQGGRKTRRKSRRKSRRKTRKV